MIKQETKKVKKGISKKLLIPLFAVLAISLVAAVAYYAMFSVTMNITQPISTDGDLTMNAGDCDDGSCSGSPITVSNNGITERTIVISNDNTNEKLVVSYTGELELTKKTVDFTKNIWEVLSNKVGIEYTLVGDSFTAEVVSGAIDGYVLVYYADNDNRFANPGQAVLVEDVLGNLPSVDDENADMNDYSLEYPTTPHGAKIWYVPLSALTLSGDAYDINWNRASEFFYESELVQFNSEGNLVVYPGSSITFTPQFFLQEGSWSGTITTTVA